MARKLVVNADDYGRTAGVSRGILEAHREGIVTSTTIMINLPGAGEYLAEALAQPRLGVGLHLTFTAGRPVLAAAEVAGLVDASGEFYDHHTLWAHAEEVPVGQLAAELEAQVARFTRLAGRLPDHLDCHHFVHLYPPFFQVYADLAARHRLPLRVPFPTGTDFRTAARELEFLEEFPQDVVRGMVVTNSALVRARGLAHPDYFDATFFGRDAVTLAHLLQILDHLPEGVTELMCHPGYDDPDLADSSYRTEREAELVVLTHPAVKERVAALGIELVTYAGVGRGHSRP
ncbi:MAG TPA: ChbG/HpnK family deacetylase [Anaerolineae bacterium]|nr:ChbG/HpnK family deacetylase [Anaerolineae bacterium]